MRERYGFKMMLIKGGYVVDPASGFEGIADILAENGKIVEIGPDIRLDAGAEGEDKGAGGCYFAKEGEIIHAEGKIVAPGLVDVHVHFREPGFTHKEDIFSGARAAAKGGFTTVVLMANTKPPVDRVETLRYVLEKGAKTGIHVESCGNITVGMKGEELTDMDKLAEAGAAGFTDDGIPLLDEALVKRAYETAARLGKPLSFHEENPAFIQNNGINAGKAAEYYGIGGSGRQAEIWMVERDLALAKGMEAEISIQHISTKEAVELVRKAKESNPHIHAEATPHHFTLTEDAAIRYGTLAKMNPPLREEEDRMAIIEGLKDGTIDMIATDHAPHSKEEKEKPITEAPSGIIGLETALSLGIRELVDKGYLNMMELISRMSWQPAQFYRLDAGYLAKGGPADLVIFDSKEKWKAEKFFSKSCNSPFAGVELPGTVHYTICGGKVVYRKSDGESKTPRLRE